MARRSTKKKSVDVPSNKENKTEEYKYFDTYTEELAEYIRKGKVTKLSDGRWRVKL